MKKTIASLILLASLTSASARAAVLIGYDCSTSSVQNSIGLRHLSFGVKYDTAQTSLLNVDAPAYPITPLSNSVSSALKAKGSVKADAAGFTFIGYDEESLTLVKLIFSASSGPNLPENYIGSALIQVFKPGSVGPVASARSTCLQVARENR